jgi:ribosomal protein L11 methyltransferase
VRDVRSDWETHWALQLAPAHLAAGLVLVAKGVVYEAAPGERVLSLEPGLFFGFGEHPTTQLICAWIAEHCAGKKVIDVGCGTGVLSLVAAHAGAASVLGIDIDVPSVESAKRNAQSNGWEATCRFSSDHLERVQERFEVVLANIDAGTLSAMGGDLARVLSPGGKLALTGVLDEQTSGLRDRFAELGVPLCVSAERQGWVLLTNHEPPSLG